MELGKLQNASTYLNNLLLARGLLRDGKSIDFACSKRSTNEPDDTMGKIINLVHDLVIRRDRDADQRESLVTNIRNLRAEEAQRTSEVERIQTKNAELMRNMAVVEGQKKSLADSAHKAEASARDLKEQMAKMKSTLDQVRAKCVNDIRKRDIELEKLRKHIAGVRRGATQSSKTKTLQSNSLPPLSKDARDARPGLTTTDGEWSLEKETTDFLTALVNETSTENVALRRIVGETMDALKEVTGLDEEAEQPPIDREIGIPGQYKQCRVNMQPAQESLVSCERLAKQMEEVVAHCRAILKDPSFVSIEEVQIREDEIVRLREGWEKMANRWKDAVAMMDVWRNRMLEGGNTVDLDELSSLGFGKSMAVMPHVPAGSEAGGSVGERPCGDAETSDGEGCESQDRESEADDDSSTLESALLPVPKRLASSPARRGVQLPRPVDPLRELNGNGKTKQSAFDQTRSTNSSTDSCIGSLDEEMDSDSFLEQYQSEMSRKVRQRQTPSLRIELICEADEQESASVVSI